MPSASSAITVLRPDLGEFTEFNLLGNENGFIAQQVLPPINVELQSSEFARIEREQLLQNPETRRGSNGGYNSIDWQFTKDNYSTEEHGLEARVDERNANIYRNFVRQEMVTAQLTAHTLRAALEKRVAAMIFNTTTWNGAALTTAAGTGWHSNSSTPITNVNAARMKVYQNTGVWPNALIINKKTLYDLKTNDDIIGAIASSGAGRSATQAEITLEMLAQVFDLPKIIVAGGTKNSAGKEGTFSPAQIWGSLTDSAGYAMVARVAETDMIEEPCLGRIFHWTADGSSLGGVIESYDDPARRGQIIRNRMDVDEKLFDEYFGHLITGV